LDRPLDSEHEDLLRSFSQKERDAIEAMRSVRSFPKGTIILSANDYITHSFYVIKGCVRQYRLIDGIDKTSQFYTENQTVHLPPTDDKAMRSKFSLECLEHSEINVVSLAAEKAFSKQFPRFERMCRISSEKNLIELQDFFANYMSSSPQERYLHLLKTRPDLLTRVPQYHLATYLGVTPESLSRIRKRVAKG